MAKKGARVIAKKTAVRNPPIKSVSKPADKSKTRRAPQAVPVLKAAPLLKPATNGKVRPAPVTQAPQPKMPAALKSAPARTGGKLVVPARVKAAPVAAKAATVPAKPPVAGLKTAVVAPKIAVAPTKVSAKSAKAARAALAREEAANRPLAPMPPAPVTTDSKPKKNQAGLSPRELDRFRELLLSKRRELLGDMSSMEREALQSGPGGNLSNLPVHMADMGTDNYEQEFTLGLVEKDRQLLREINQALAKIQDGTYGICEGTGKPIPTARLEIQPWARHSVEWARQLEKNMMLRR